MFTESTYFRFNRTHTYKLTESNCVDCEQAKDLMELAIHQNNDRKQILTFQFSPTVSSLECMQKYKERIASRGSQLDVVHSRRELPENLRKGYDYDDLALWNSGFSHIYISNKS